MQKVSEEKNTLEKKVSDGDEQIKDLTARLAKCEAALTTKKGSAEPDNKLQEEIDRLKKALTEAQEEIARLKNTLADIQEENARLKKSLADVQVETENTRPEAQRLQQLVEEYKQENASSKTALAEVQEKLQQTQKELSELETRTSSGSTSKQLEAELKTIKVSLSRALERVFFLKTLILT